jgi:hypothetical protein
MWKIADELVAVIHDLGFGAVDVCRFCYALERERRRCIVRKENLNGDI